MRRHPKPVTAVLLITMLLALAGCSSTTILGPHKAAEDLNSYTKIQIAGLSISSDEKSGGSEEANQLLRGYFTERLTDTIRKTGRQVVSESAPTLPDEHILVINEEVQVHYGNRALRYVVGFGAGKGTAAMVLTAKDKVTDQIKYSDVRSVELTGGTFGGDFQGVVRNHVAKQIQLYAKALRTN